MIFNKTMRSFSLLLCLMLSVDAVSQALTIAAYGRNLFAVNACAQPIRKAYRQLGIELSLVGQPYERAFAMAASGHTDGLVCASAIRDQMADSLIKIDPAIYYARIMAFTRSGAEVIHNYTDLHGGRVGFVRGMDIADERVKRGAEKVTNALSGFRMLRAGRLDVFIDLEPHGLEIIEKEHMRGVTKQPQPLEIIPLFHYIHKKNEYLKSSLTAAFRKP